MSEATPTVIESAEVFASQLLYSLPESFIYHNISYTRGIIRAIDKILEYASLSEESSENVKVAAWLQLIGQTKSYDRYVESSVAMAEDYLKKEGFSVQRLTEITDCIRVAAKVKEPENRAENVLRDADFLHLSRGGYFEKSLIWRREIELCEGEEYDDVAWHERSIKFLQELTFYTEYGKAVLESRRKELLLDEQKVLKKLTRFEDELVSSHLNLDPMRVKELKKKIKKAEDRPDRGIETMFRLTSRNHISLSAIADNKANILISVNAIIISIIIGSLYKKLDINPELQLPTYIMLSVNIITIVFAILATRPSYTKGKFTRQDIEGKKTNLLFFGNFHNMEQDEYRWAMFEMMEKSDFLYSSLIDDIYFLGKVLGAKYYRLRIAYTIFMFGMIISVIAFVTANFA